MTEHELLDKLAKIEALHAGTTSTGERAAAAEARQRLRDRLDELRAHDSPIEMRFAVHDPWSRRLLVAMLRRYGIEPYRRSGQHRQSVMAKVPRRFVDETLMPHFEASNAALHGHLSEVAERIISTAVGDGDFEDDGDRRLS